MSVSRAIKCDNCSTVDMMDQKMQDDLHHDGAPRGWIRLFINAAPRYSWERSDGPVGKRSGWMDICSLSCARSILLNHYSTDD